MRIRRIALLALSFAIAANPAQYKPKGVNKAIELLEQNQPVFYVGAIGGYEEGRRMYDSQWSFSGAPYPVALLTDSRSLDNSSFKGFQVGLGPPGITDSIFPSYRVSGNIQSTTVSCGP
jgi:hypothetical protein